MYRVLSFMVILILEVRQKLYKGYVNCFDNNTNYTVKSFIFMGLKFRGFVFKNVFVDIYFRCFLICSQK